MGKGSGGGGGGGKGKGGGGGGAEEKGGEKKTDPAEVFTATTKSGKDVTSEGREVRLIATPDGMKYAVVLSPADVKKEMGVTLPSSQKEAFVILNDQKKYKESLTRQDRKAYEAERARNPQKAKRDDLRSALDRAIDKGGADAFPGSRAAREYQSAVKALREFDAKNPNI